MSGHNHIFHTEEVRPQGSSSAPNSIAVTVSPFVDFPIGLTLLDFYRERNIRIRSYFDSFEFIGSNRTFSATVHLDAWDDTVMHAAACTWLPIFQPDRDFQHGKSEIRPGRLVLKINFRQEYASTPKVVVWLSGLDIDSATNWHLCVSPMSVTTAGLTLKGEVWGSTNLHWMEVSWIAYPASRPNIDSGRFHTSELRDWQNVRHEHSKAVTFEKKFDRPPKVYFALNRIDATRTGNLRLKAYVEDVTMQGMTLHLDSWSDTHMYSTEGHWIAVQDL